MASGNNAGGGKNNNKQKTNPFNSGGSTWGFGAPAPVKEDSKTEKSTSVKDETKAENENKKAPAADSTVDKDTGNGITQGLVDLQLKDTSEELEEENPWASSAKVGKMKKGAKSGADDKPIMTAKPGTKVKSSEDNKSSDNSPKTSNIPAPKSKDVSDQNAPVSNAMDTPTTPVAGGEETQTTPIVRKEDAQTTSTTAAKDTQTTLTTSEKGTQTDPVEFATSKPTSKSIYRETFVQSDPIESAKLKPIYSNASTQIERVAFAASKPTTTDAGTQTGPITIAAPKPIYVNSGTQTDSPPTTTDPPPIPKVNPTPYGPPTIGTSDPIINLTSNNTSLVSAHMGLLARNSDYFAEFFLPGPLHAKKYRYGPDSTRTTISLKKCLTHAPEMFELEVYTEWLYSGVLGDHLTMSDEVFEDLVDLYVFREQIQDKVFCNAVMDMITWIQGKERYLWLRDVVKMVYEKTGKGSKLRDFVADMYAWNAELDGSVLREFAGDMHKEFLVDMVVGIVECREKNSEAWYDVWLVEEGYYVK